MLYAIPHKSITPFFLNPYSTPQPVLSLPLIAWRRRGSRNGPSRDSIYSGIIGAKFCDSNVQTRINFALPYLLTNLIREEKEGRGMTNQDTLEDTAPVGSTPLGVVLAVATERSRSSPHSHSDRSNRACTAPY